MLIYSIFDTSKYSLQQVIRYAELGLKKRSPDLNINSGFSVSEAMDMDVTVRQEHWQNV